MLQQLVGANTAASYFPYNSIQTVYLLSNLAGGLHVKNKFRLGMFGEISNRHFEMDTES